MDDYTLAWIGGVVLLWLYDILFGDPPDPPDRRP